MAVTAYSGSMRPDGGLVGAAGLGCAWGTAASRGRPGSRANRRWVLFVTIAGCTSLLTFGLYAAWPRWENGPFPVGRLLL